MAPIRGISILVLLSWVPTISDQAFASPPQPRFREEELSIPKRPSAPPALIQKAPGEISNCDRFFVYQGRKLDCDSNVRQDGENLRPIIQDVPSAVSELDSYQENRRGVRTAAYIGTLGLLLAVGGFYVGRSITDPNGNQSQLGNAVRNVGVVGGLGLLGGSFLYAFVMLKTNERHLGNAVQYYNQANAEKPIELQFSTSFHF